MTRSAIENTLDRYNRLVLTGYAAMKNDEARFIDGSWYKNIIFSHDITEVELSEDGKSLIFSGQTWTNTTGGTYEYFAFIVPLSKFKDF